MDMVFGARRRVRAALGDTALDYAQVRGWSVVPGARLVRVGRAERCSCATPDCATPGLHPASDDWAQRATTEPARVRAAWAERPDAPIVLPTGTAFDVIDVPAPAGLRALARLERMGTRLGPVALTPAGRVRFFVDAGTALDMPRLLRRLGWDGVELDLRVHGPGDFVFAPPSPMGALGAARWLRRPTHGNAWLPEARLLLGTISYACHRTGGGRTDVGLWRAS